MIILKFFKQGCSAIQFSVWLYHFSGSGKSIPSSCPHLFTYHLHCTFCWPSSAAWGILIPRSRIEPVSLQWKCGVLTTGLPGKSQHSFELRRSVNHLFLGWTLTDPDRILTDPDRILPQRSSQSAWTGYLKICQGRATSQLLYPKTSSIMH